MHVGLVEVSESAIAEKESHLATDYAKLSENLCRFYDFTGKVVLFIGAAGRQLLDPSAQTRKLIAIDKDVEALRELKASIVAKGLQDSVEVIGDPRFESVRTAAAEFLKVEQG